MTGAQFVWDIFAAGAAGSNTGVWRSPGIHDFSSTKSSLLVNSHFYLPEFKTHSAIVALEFPAQVVARSENQEAV
jgi:hypothetical protein